MDDGDLFFTERNGDVWAVWLSGRPPVNMGSVADVRAAMAQFSVLAGAAGTPASDDYDRPATAPAAPTVPESPPPRPRNASERIEQRHGIKMPGKVFSAGGSREIIVLDLSERGCRFRDTSNRLVEGARITVKLGEVGPIEAMVMWSDGTYVGVRFANPLYPSIMQHIRDAFDRQR